VRERNNFKKETSIIQLQTTILLEKISFKKIIEKILLRRYFPPN